MRAQYRDASGGAARFSLHLLAGAAFTCTWGLQSVVAYGISLPGLFVYAAAFFGALETVSRRALKSRLDAYDLVPVALATWAVLSNAWTPAPAATFSMSYYYVLCAIVYVLVRRACNGRTSHLYLGAAYVAGCGVSAALVALAWGSGANFRGDRFTIGGLNPNYVAYSLAMGIAMCGAVWSAGVRSLRHQAFMAVVVGLSVMGILLSGCRSALLAIALVALVLGAGYVRQGAAVKVVAVGVVLIVAYALFQELPEGLKVRLLSLTDPAYDPAGKADLSGRLYLWPIALDLIEKHPMRGVGAGAFASLNDLGIAAHNVALAVAVELGVVGLGLYGTVVWRSFSAPLRATHHPEFRSGIFQILVAWLAIASAGAWEVTLVAWFGFAWTSKLALLKTQATGPVEAPISTKR